jgi:uncharacterized phage infection (PIP) family protein YhgE
VAELLNFKFAMIGKSVIEFSVGSPNLPVIEDGSTITIKESLNLVKLVTKFEPVLIMLQDSIVRINEILQAIDPQQISRNVSNLEAISSDLKAISRQIQQGKGIAGSVIYDQQLQRDVASSTANLKTITEQTKAIIVQTSLLLNSLQQQVDEIPELTDKVKPLLDEADKTIKATQQIWPLSGNVTKHSRETLTPPALTE